MPNGFSRARLAPPSELTSLATRETRGVRPWGRPCPPRELAPRVHSGGDGAAAGATPDSLTALARRARRCIDPISDVRPASAPRAPEVYADSATVHIIPSYLVVPAEFFKDLEEAQVRMAQAGAALASQLRMSDLMQDLPTKPNPDPKFSATWLTQSIQNDSVILDRAMRDGAVAEQVKRFMVVQPRREG